jgi:hypothetical protein
MYVNKCIDVPLAVLDLSCVHRRWCVRELAVHQYVDFFFMACFACSLVH